jgi:hypothetical protein
MAGWHRTTWTQSQGNSTYSTLSLFPFLKESQKVSERTESPPPQDTDRIFVVGILRCGVT